MKHIFTLLVISGMSSAAQAAAPAQRTTPPNIVFILADDLGWSDTTLYGTTRLYQTPNIERLAERGMRFTQAYAANPLCSPTRASILSGLYPGRIGMTLPSGGAAQEIFKSTLPSEARPWSKVVEPVSVTRLKYEYTTLAEVLHEAGYRTAHFGKWHVGREPYDPLHRGFDVDIPHTPNIGTPRGGYLAPWRFITDPRYQGAPGEHIEDRLSAEAAKFIHENKDRPFFVNYWTYSVHSPWSAKPELVAKYRKRVDHSSPQHSPLFAAMVQSMDEGVGRILDAIDQAGVADKTIIVFFSDNGGYCWPGPAGLKDTGSEDGLPATSNAPLRGGKANLWEGGTREPMVVVWPGKTKPNSRTDALFCSVDFYPTLLEMAGIARKPGQRLDGVSQAPVLLGTGMPRDAVYCYFPHYALGNGNGLPGVWARRGDWKLIRYFCDGPGLKDRFELYNLKEDIGETRDLAADHPDRVRELSVLIDKHLEDIHALLPKPNPAYRPDAPLPPSPFSRPEGG
jgi:arylsulfatase A-like enzyme